VASRPVGRRTTSNAPRPRCVARSAGATSSARRAITPWLCGCRRLKGRPRALSGPLSLTPLMPRSGRKPSPSAWTVGRDGATEVSASAPLAPGQSTATASALPATSCSNPMRTRERGAGARSVSKPAIDLIGKDPIRCARCLAGCQGLAAEASLDGTMRHYRPGRRSPMDAGRHHVVQTSSGSRFAVPAQGASCACRVWIPSSRTRALRGY
jgi:hypothetical protein